MGNCCGKQVSSSIAPNKVEVNEEVSLNSAEKNLLKKKVFVKKIDDAPKLQLESNAMYKKRKDSQSGDA